jgi:ferredoxin-thioredoxin reductase catalytic chain
MKPPVAVSDEEVAVYRQKIQKTLDKRGYYFNPDDSFTNDLLRGVLVNLQRYGYECCPCRLAAKDRTKDFDIICPCYYRDDDVSEYGTCYCALYVSKQISLNRAEVGSIPERRTKPLAQPRRIKVEDLTINHTVWRCQVCGYLCARDTAPDTCPICGVPKDRFEVFIDAK